VLTLPIITTTPQIACILVFSGMLYRTSLRLRLWLSRLGISLRFFSLALEMR